MISFFRFLIFILITAFCVFFAIENQDAVNIAFSPLHDNVELPSFIPALSGLGAGFLAGALLGWLNLLPKKLEIYRLKKQIIKLEKQVEEQIVEEEDNKSETILPSTIKNADELYD